MQQTWQVITNLGAASLLAPMIPLIAIAFWLAREKSAAVVWLFALGFAVFLTLATKIAFMGWGIGIKAIGFTGISGHTVLASAVLPVLFGWASAARTRVGQYTGVVLGALLALLVGISRLALDAHSVSEVIAGWLAGALVSAATLWSLKRSEPLPRAIAALPIFLALALDTNAATYLPSHQWEIKLSLLLSGRDKPFTRSDL
jgi:membrane-associated phospholipid phosphatase